MRHHTLSAFAALSVLALAASASAQGLELPAPSPKARVEQRVGITDFSVDYSSPAVKGRKLWGALVPYDHQWRTGANASTKLTASRDFKFGGQPVKAGTYALYTIPGKTSWVVALSSALEASGNDAFDVAKDVARATVKPETIRGRERMTFLFTGTTDSSARLDLEWGKLRVGVPLEVDTKGQALAAIDAAVKDAWRPHFQAARYLLENGGDLDQALALAEQSVAIKATWWNQWVRAQALAKKNRASDAVAAAEAAAALGAGDRIYEGFFKADVEKNIAAWKKTK